MDLNPQPFSTRLKVFSIGVFVLLLLLVAPAKWFGIGTQSYQKSELSQAQTDLVVQNISEDTDNDGIPNWKESLFGTSPTTKNKLPAVVTEEAPVSPEEKKALARLDDPKNLTSQYIKNTVGLSTYLSDQGVTDEATLAQVSENIVVEAEKLSAVRTFTRLNLESVTNDEKLSTIKTYGNAVALLLIETYATLDIPNIIKPLEAYTLTKDSKQLNSYGPMAQFLNEVIKKLTKISVPSSAVESHLYVLNAFEAFRVTLLGLSNAEEDPMQGLVAVNGYKDSFAAFLNSTLVLATYFGEKGAVFTSKENASVFTQVILSQ